MRATTIYSITVDEEKQSEVVAHGYCDDPACWCHSDSDYHDLLIHPSVTEEEIEQMYSFLGISR